MRRRDVLRGLIGAGLGASGVRLIGEQRGGALASPDTGIALPSPSPAAPGVPAVLEAKPATISVWPGMPTTLFTYGGTYPSPTLRIRQGETFDLRLDNQLPEGTNIHWHGLDVPAALDGHPMDVIAPGGSQQYTFPILDRAGTYWYHPHPDMLTAAHVYRGMAGFFIVADDVEDALGLPSGAQDVPLLLQDRRYVPDGSFTYAPAGDDLMWGYLGDVALVNGVPDAEVAVGAGTYRFRLLNGSNGRIFKIAFEDGRAFQVIGGDGGLLERPYSATSLFLSVGERAEIFVDFSGPTLSRTVRLVSLPFNGGGLAEGHRGHRRERAPAGGAWPQGEFFPILTFAIRGSAPVTPLPNRLRRFSRLGPGVRRRSFTMDMRLPPVPGNFWINGLPYDMSRVDFQVPRGVVEEWTVKNLSAHPHPFHVHATQFQVLSRSTGPLAPHEMALKDTVLVWPAETVRLAIRFDHYAGLYVLHCHNLEHEDAGMMSNFEVV
jgi:FtsP/CotA-like multicopper oxidase with cupredoxin domain